jgi:hypothetical protein
MTRWFTSGMDTAHLPRVIGEACEPRNLPPNPLHDVAVTQD